MTIARKSRARYLPHTDVHAAELSHVQAPHCAPIYLLTPCSHQLTPPELTAMTTMRDWWPVMCHEMCHVSCDITFPLLSPHHWLVGRVWGQMRPVSEHLMCLCTSLDLTLVMVTGASNNQGPSHTQHSIQSADNCEFITSLNYLVSCQWQLYKMPRAVAVSSWSI